MNYRKVYEELAHLSALLPAQPISELRRFSPRERKFWRDWALFINKKPDD